MSAGTHSPSLARDGYALLPRFIEEAEIAALDAEVGQCLSRPLPGACERPHNTLVPLRWGDAVVSRILSSPGRRGRLSAAAAARDLRWISGYLSIKEPHTPALWWHQDWWCWDHPASYLPDAPQVALLCYPGDTDASNAAMRVLAGTQHRSIALHADLPEAHAEGAEQLPVAHPAMCDHPDQTTLCMRAGDAALIDYRLLHGTHPNASATRRDCVLLSFAPDWSGLPTEIRAHLISHPALPHRGEQAHETPGWGELLPDYRGPRRDLALSRRAPSRFAIEGPPPSEALQPGLPEGGVRRPPPAGGWRRRRAGSVARSYRPPGAPADWREGYDALG